MSEKKSEEQRISAVPPFGLRMLPELRQLIEAAAEANQRSLNAEIHDRLYETFLRDSLASEPMSRHELLQRLCEESVSLSRRIAALSRDIAAEALAGERPQPLDN